MPSTLVGPYICSSFGIYHKGAVPPALLAHLLATDIQTVSRVREGGYIVGQGGSIDRADRQGSQGLKRLLPRNRLTTGAAGLHAIELSCQSLFSF